MLQILLFVAIIVLCIWAIAKLEDTYLEGLLMLPILVGLCMFFMILYWTVTSLETSAEYKKRVAERDSLVAEWTIVNSCGNEYQRVDTGREIQDWNYKLEDNQRSNSLWLFDPLYDDRIMELQPIEL